MDAVATRLGRSRADVIEDYVRAGLVHEGVTMNSRIVQRHLMRHRSPRHLGRPCVLRGLNPARRVSGTATARSARAPAGRAAVVYGWFGDPRDGCLSAVAFTADPAFRDWHWTGAYCAVQPNDQIDYSDRVDMPPADLLAHAQQRVWCARWLQGRVTWSARTC